MDKLSRSEILKKIANHSLSSAEGLKLLKDLKKNKETQPDSLFYVKDVWKSVNLSSKNSESSGKVLLMFDQDGTFIPDIDMGQTSYQKLVKIAGKQSDCKDAQHKADFHNLEDLEAVLKEYSSYDILYCWKNGTMDEAGIVYQLIRALIKKHFKVPVHFMAAADNLKGEELLYFEALESLMKTVHMENPKLWCRILNLGRKSNDSQLADLIIKEIQDVDRQKIYIRYDGSERRAHELEEADLSETVNQMPIKKKGCYIITGGLGGLGVKFSSYLASNYQADLILLGRSELNDEGRKKIESIQKEGCYVEYKSVDVCNEEEVYKLFQSAEKEGRKIDGIIHCAGIIQDKMIASKTVEEFLKVIRVKVEGSMALYHAMNKFGAGLLVLFSSITAALGNVGQSDYAYGNAFENSLAYYHESENRDGMVVAIGWPLWQNGGMMVADAIRDMMKKKFGLYLISDENGIKAFETLLQSEFRQMFVFDGEKELILEKAGVKKDEAASKKQVSKKAEAKPVLKAEKKPVNKAEKKQIDKVGKKHSMDEKELKQKVNNYLKQVIHEVTSISYSDIGVNESFGMYGMDSITAMKINDILEEHFGELSKTLIFEYQCINDLSQYFIDNHYEQLLELYHMDEEEETDETEEIEEIEETEEVDEIEEAEEIQEEEPETQSFGFKKRNAAEEGIAVIGVAGRYPKADNMEEFWDNLMNGVDCIEKIPKSRWDASLYFDEVKGRVGKSNSMWGGFLSNVDEFDPLFFNISPRDATLMDPQERIFLEVTWSALEDAGYYKESLSDQKVGVFAGVMNGQYQMIPAAVKGTKLAHMSVLASVANRVSYHFNFTGPSIALDTMCSSSMTAINLACDSIEKGESDVAIAGGVMTMLHPDKYLYLGQGRFLSSEGKCRAFGEGGDGYVPAEGAGVIILKPLKKAIEDRDNIYGVIKGHAMNHGGKTSGYTVPNPNAQAEVIKAAIKDSGIDVNRITYVETHGTGTELGDPIEITGLVNAMDGKKKENSDRECVIGAVKANIGHSEAAAGVASLTKVLLQLKHKMLVPSIHSSVLNKKIAFDKTIFRVEQNLEPWEAQTVIENGKKKELPRCAGISSFGAGGTNGHLIVEEYQTEFHEEKDRKCFIPLSAKTEERLVVYANRLLNYMKKAEKDKNVRLTDIAYTLQIGREVMKTRVAFLVKSKTDLIEKLQQFCEDVSESDQIYYYDSPSIENKDSFLLDGSEGKNYIDAVIKYNKTDKLAKLWVRGYQIDFEKLYKGIEHHKISLPTYPFLQERYWLPQEFAEEAASESISRLHPLVHENVSDLNGICFASDFDMKTEENKSFKWDNTQVFSPFALLQMVYESAKIAGKKKCASLEQVAMGNPEILNQDKLHLETRIYPLSESAVSCETVDQNEEILIQSVVNYEAQEMPEPMDVETAMQSIPVQDDIQSVFERLKESGLDANKLQDALLEFGETEDEMLAEVSLNGTEAKIFGSQLLDMVLLLSNLFVSENEVYSVCGIDNMSIIGDITKECYVYIRKLEDTEGEIVLSACIWNDAEECILTLDHIMLQRCSEDNTSENISFE